MSNTGIVCIAIGLLLTIIWISIVEIKIWDLRQDVSRNRKDIELLCKHLGVEVWHSGWDKTETRYLRPKEEKQ